MDLLDKTDIENSEYQDFAQKNDFCGSFRTSAKTGFNISESMQYLIGTLIKRIEDDYEKKIIELEERNKYYEKYNKLNKYFNF